MPSFAIIGAGGGLTGPLTSTVLESMPAGEAGVASGGARTVEAVSDLSEAGAEPILAG
jgi:hypothetical protein